MPYDAGKCSSFNRRQGIFPRLFLSPLKKAATTILDRYGPGWTTKEQWSKQSRCAAVVGEEEEGAAAGGCGAWEKEHV